MTMVPKYYMYVPKGRGAVIVSYVYYVGIFIDKYLCGNNSQGGQDVGRK